MFRLFMTPVLFAASECAGHHKAGEKQVAMIAQKVMDANQTQHEWRPSITASHARASTFRALLAYH